MQSPISPGEAPFDIALPNGAGESVVGKLANCCQQTPGGTKVKNNRGPRRRWRKLVLNSVSVNEFRSAFISGQEPLSASLSAVGLPRVAIFSTCAPKRTPALLPARYANCLMRAHQIEHLGVEMKPKCGEWG